MSHAHALCAAPESLGKLAPRGDLKLNGPFMNHSLEFLQSWPFTPMWDQPPIRLLRTASDCGLPNGPWS